MLCVVFGVIAINGCKESALNGEWHLIKGLGSTILGKIVNRS